MIFQTRRSRALVTALGLNKLARFMDSEKSNGMQFGTFHGVTGSLYFKNVNEVRAKAKQIAKEALKFK